VLRLRDVAWEPVEHEPFAHRPVTRRSLIIAIVNSSGRPAGLHDLADRLRTRASAGGAEHVAGETCGIP